MYVGVSKYKEKNSSKRRPEKGVRRYLHFPKPRARSALTSSEPSFILRPKKVATSACCLTVTVTAFQVGRCVRQKKGLELAPWRTGMSLHRPDWLCRAPSRQTKALKSMFRHTSISSERTSHRHDQFEKAIIEKVSFHSFRFGFLNHGYHRPISNTAAVQTRE